MGMALALHDLGRQSEFDAAFAELREMWGEEAPWAVAAVYAYSNDIDAAFEWLERYVAAGKQPGGSWYAPVRDPWYSNLYTDPRWQDVLEHMGFAPAQIEKLNFHVTLPDYVTREQNRI